MFQQTWHFLLVALAGFINRQQQDMIAYLQEENRILREKLGGKRLLLNVAQKRRLAMAAKKLGRDFLKGWATLFTPETLLHWHRTLVAGKYDGSGKRGPKPKKANEVRDHVLRMKEENPDWGYGHIHGELKGLGYKISWQTVRRIMIEHGLMDDPKNTKKMSWTTFIKSHFESMSACDFFCVHAWTPRGLKRTPSRARASILGVLMSLLPWNPKSLYPSSSTTMIRTLGFDVLVADSAGAAT